MIYQRYYSPTNTFNALIITWGPGDNMSRERALKHVWLDGPGEIGVDFIAFVKDGDQAKALYEKFLLTNESKPK